MNTVLTFDNVLTYNKNFKKHGLEVMAGSSWTDSDYSNSWINGSHYRSDLIQTLNAAIKYHGIIQVRVRLNGGLCHFSDV